MVASPLVAEPSVAPVSLRAALSDSFQKGPVHFGRPVSMLICYGQVFPKYEDQC